MRAAAWNGCALLAVGLAAGCATPRFATGPVQEMPKAAAGDEASATPPSEQAQGSADDAENLAKKLNNPVANLISVPFQFNRDENIGPDEHGERNYLNFQPVIPIELNEDWNVISRTIVPVIGQSDIAPGTGHQGGLGDILQSFFFSPVKPTSDGWIWGVGPALLLPTANDDLLGQGKYGAGPTAVVLKQDGPWTYGGLGNHIWSYAGDDDRRDVNNTYLQPFVAYTTHEAWTYALNSESNYNWEADQWSVPFNFMVSKLVHFGRQPVSIGVGIRYWAQTPDDVGPDGFGYRLIITPLFPK